MSINEIISQVQQVRVSLATTKDAKALKTLAYSAQELATAAKAAPDARLRAIGADLEREAMMAVMLAERTLAQAAQRRPKTQASKPMLNWARRTFIF